MRQGKATGEMKNQPTEEGKLTDFRDSSLWAPISRNREQLRAGEQAGERPRPPQVRHRAISLKIWR